METVAVVGLGRVGLPLALFPTDRGRPVIDVECEPAVLEQLTAGHMPFSDTGTQEQVRVHLSQARKRIVADLGRELVTQPAAGGEGPHVFGLEHRPSFEVGVQRRWTSVEKAGRLLGSRFAARGG
jgi:hypothetical protein